MNKVHFSTYRLGAGNKVHFLLFPTVILRTFRTNSQIESKIISTKKLKISFRMSGVVSIRGIVQI